MPRLPARQVQGHRQLSQRLTGAVVTKRTRVCWSERLQAWVQGLTSWPHGEPQLPCVKGRLWCGRRTLTVDCGCLGPNTICRRSPARRTSLCNSRSAWCLVVAMDCSTKSRAREIKRQAPDGRPLPKPFRSEQYPEGLQVSSCKISSGCRRTIWLALSCWIRSSLWWNGAASGRIRSKACAGTFHRSSA